MLTPMVALLIAIVITPLSITIMIISLLIIITIISLLITIIITFHPIMITLIMKILIMMTLIATTRKAPIVTIYIPVIAGPSDIHYSIYSTYSKSKKLKKNL